MIIPPIGAIWNEMERMRKNSEKRFQDEKERMNKIKENKIDNDKQCDRSGNLDVHSNAPSNRLSQRQQ